MKIRVFYALPILVLLSATGYAEQDFYGIQMKNELWAQNLVLEDGPSADPRDLSEGPVLSHEVHAEASLKAAADDHLDFRVNVINDSSSEIESDYRYRDFFIYTKDGRKYPLIDEDEDARLNTIEPKSSRIFSPSLGNLRVRNEDVRMVSCSFDLGKTEIFLFPWSRKEEIGRLASPAPSPEPAKPTLRFLSRPAKSKAPQERAPVMTAPPVSSAASAQFSPSQSQAPPSSRTRLDEAIKNFVYKPAEVIVAPFAGTPAAPQPSASVSAPAASAGNPAVAAATRSEAHVINYDKKYNFVTVNMGFKDGLKQNMPLSILRDGKTVAKAKVKQLRDRVAAAILLPGTVQTEIRPGDKISFV